MSIGSKTLLRIFFRIFAQLIDTCHIYQTKIPGSLRSVAYSRLLRRLAMTAMAILRIFFPTETVQVVAAYAAGNLLRKCCDTFSLDLVAACVETCHIYKSQIARSYCLVDQF